VEWLEGAQNDSSAPASDLARVRAVAMFGGPAREAVHALKYENRHAISGMMGRLMAESVRELPFDIVAPLSLHPSRRRERGYDQAVMLARHVADALGVPVHRTLVRRIRKTKQQALLDKGARRENVRGAFEVTERMDASRILLVDDVYTTGATLRAGAWALRVAGAREVRGAVVAIASG
jgi:ComF family protein